MRSARDELRDFARRRRRLAAELLLCAVAAWRLYVVSAGMDPVAPEIKAFFVMTVGLFTGAFARLTPELISVSLFRCPRCRHRFHAAARRWLPRLAVRACAHCRFRASAPGALPPPGRVEPTA